MVCWSQHDERFGVLKILRIAFSSQSTSSFRRRTLLHGISFFLLFTLKAAYLLKMHRRTNFRASLNTFRIWWEQLLKVMKHWHGRISVQSNIHKEFHKNQLVSTDTHTHTHTHTHIHIQTHTAPYLDTWKMMLHYCDLQQSRFLSHYLKPTFISRLLFDGDRLPS